MKLINLDKSNHIKCYCLGVANKQANMMTAAQTQTIFNICHIYKIR